MDAPDVDMGGRLAALAGAGLFVVAPLAFDPFGWAVYGPSKWLFITATSLVAFGLALLRSITFDVRWVTGWAAFLLWMAIAGSWAMDPLSHWIGTPDRRLGWLAWLSFALVFVAGQQLVSDSALRLVGRGAIVGLVIIGAIVGLEAIGVSPLESSSGSTRLGGPFGNAAYLGAAAVLMTPVAAASAALDGNRSWRGAGWTAVASGIAAVAASQSRAGWIAALMAAAFWVRMSWPILRRRRLLLFAAASIAIAMIAITPVGSRFQRAFDVDDPGGRGRVAEWSIAIDVIGAHPLGVGLEGYRIAFVDHVDEAYARNYGREVIPDRAHNTILDLTSAGGLPVAIMSTAAMIALSRVAYAIAKEPETVGIGAALAGYLVHQLFFFPTAELDPLFWLLAGIGVGHAATGQTRTTDLLRYAVPLVVAGVAVTAAFGLRDVVADRHVAAALTAADPTEALAEADAATSLRSDSFRYWLISADAARRQGAFDAATDRIGRAEALAPEDPVIDRAHAQLLLDRATEIGTPADLAAAVHAWEAVVVRDPHNAGNQLQYGLSALASGDVAAAESAWLAAEALAPGSPVPALNLSRLYTELGRSGDASAALHRALAIDPAADLGVP